jgi:dihydroneopterin aldolase
MGRDRIRLVNMTFYGHHGVDDSERRLGGRFAMDIELVRDLSAAGRTDDLSQTVDYKAVYELVRQTEAGRKYQLLEALVHDVAQAILRAFDVEEVTVRARKQSVPLGGLVDYTEVEIARTRADLVSA